MSEITLKLKPYIELHGIPLKVHTVTRSELQAEYKSLPITVTYIFFWYFRMKHEREN